MRTVGRDSATPGEVLIVTGPAAAGKTTVARRLAEESDEPSVHLHADDFFKALKKGRLRGWTEGAAPQHEVVFEAVGSAAGVYAAGGYFVVLDTLVRPQFLDILVGSILRRTVPVHLVVLRPALDQVVARSNGRNPSERHEEAILRGLYEHFRDLGDLERHVVDNSGHDPEHTVEVTRRMLREGRLRPPAIQPQGRPRSMIDTIRRPLGSDPAG